MRATNLETLSLGVLFLVPEQDLKHITVNKALKRIDAVIHIDVASVTVGPPSQPEEG